MKKVIEFNAEDDGVVKHPVSHIEERQVHGEIRVKEWHHPKDIIDEPDVENAFEFTSTATITHYTAKNGGVEIGLSATETKLIDCMLHGYLKGLENKPIKTSIIIREGD